MPCFLGAQVFIFPIKSDFHDRVAYLRFSVMDVRGDGIFPDEVVIQILARLPVKSLFRFKTVCKLWYRLSLDKYFIQLYRCLGRTP